MAATSSQALNLLRIGEELSAVHLRLSQVVIEHMDWAKCIERHDRPHTMFDCDPPYWSTTDCGVGFGLEQYDRVAELIWAIQGRMIVSV